MGIPSRPEDIPDDELSIHPVAWAILGVVVSFAAYAYLFQG